MIARDESDFASEQFLQWFIKEQVEEVATMSDLLAVVRRNAEMLENIEEYVAREGGGEAATRQLPASRAAEGSRDGPLPAPVARSSVAPMEAP